MHLRVWLLTGLSTCLLWGATRVSAQEGGVEGPPKPSTQDESDFVAMLRDSSRWNQDVFDRVSTYRVYSLTLPGSLETLPATRKKWKSELSRAESKGRDACNQVLLDRCYALAIGQLPPGDHLQDPVARGAVQVNAMIIVAELNQQESAGQSPPVPLPAALPKLIEAWGKPDLSDAVKAVVLQGFERHALAGIADEAQRQTIQKAMLELLAAKAPPPTREAEVQLWFRRSAADTLAALGAAGLTADSAEVVQALLGVIGDADQPLSIRSTAAQALGRLNLKAPAGMNLSLAAHQVGRLAVEVANAKPDSVARLKAQIQRTNDALAGEGQGRGLLAAADETHKPFLEGLQGQMAPIKQAVDKIDEKGGLVIPPAVHDAAAALAKWLDENAPQSKELLAAKS